MNLAMKSVTADSFVGEDVNLRRRESGEDMDVDGMCSEGVQSIMAYDCDKTDSGPIRAFQRPCERCNCARKDRVPHINLKL